jgi:hypothetical protein
MDRFNEWNSFVPPNNETVGLDEHTGLILDFETGFCEVSGVSSVSLVRKDNPEIYPSGSKFPLSDLGKVVLPAPLEKDIPTQVWDMVLNAPPLDDDAPPPEVAALAQQRLAARTNKNWAESDKLRDEISALGWIVQDAKDGYKLVRN